MYGSAGFITAILKGSVDVAVEFSVYGGFKQRLPSTNMFILDENL